MNATVVYVVCCFFCITMCLLVVVFYEDGATALMFACSSGHTELARMLLLEGNADINIRDNVSKYL